MDKKNSQFYRLYELRDVLEEGINNNETYLKEQTNLVETLKKVENAKDFENLIKSLESQFAGIKQRIVQLQTRLTITKSLILSYEVKDKKSEELDELVSNIFHAIGWNYYEDSDELKKA